MKRVFFAALVVVLALMWLTASHAAEPNMKDGLWEITTKTEMKGMPGKIPANVMKQCLTRKESVPQNKDPKSNCKMVDQKVSGDTVTWTMVCKEKDGTIEGKGSITYKGDSFDGTTKTTITAKGAKTQEITTKMSGKRLGPCPATKK